MPGLIRAHVASAYYEPPTADDRTFHLQSIVEERLFRKGPSHEERTNLVAKARADLIADGLLTAEELDTLGVVAAATLAIKRWKTKNPAWPELPPTAASES